ncbi:MAG: Ig-like domain-containing protein, partial [Chloroflexaceae bacterium]|nr:Ig-like domain-containing protein [Chloroflexaceae bacterium]
MKPRNIIIALIGLVALLVGVFAAPLALRGPQVVAISPADGSQTVNPLAPFRIEFDQWVQADSLRTAVSLEPAAPFELAVERNVATLTPQGGLRYGASYRLTIGAGVRNLLGRSMEQPASTSFATVPYVAVANFGPANDAKDVALNAPLTVEFASPVLSAELVQQAADDPRVSVPQPLVLNPAVPGTGRWLSPSRFSFSPDEGWSAATTYSATLNEQLIPDGSARMEQAVSWQFSTSATLLAGTRPFDGATEVAADGTIEVRLARDVDVASASQQFTLTKKGESQPVQGSVQADKGGFFFKPAAPLERGATYTASIGAGVKAASGAAINTQPLTWNFSVIGDLAVLESFPPASASDVLTLTQQIGVRFNHPVVAVTTPADASSLPVPLTITPPVQGLGRWLDTSTFIISPTAPLNPSTQYQVAVAAGLQDQTGGALKEAFSFSFTTMSPLVNGSIPADREQYASPTEPLLLVFNQPMDIGSLQGAVRLLAPDGSAVPGTLARASRNATVFLPGDGNKIPPSDFTGFTVAFTPNQPLARGGRYTLQVDTAARAEGSNAPLANVYESVFQVAPLPALVETTPPNGASAANPGFPVRLDFGTPMDWASVEQNLTIEPKPTELMTGTSTTEFYPYFMLEPETDYRISVGGAARDQWGVSLGREVSFSFRTAALEPSLTLVGVNNQVGMYNANVAIRVPLQTTNIPNLSYRLWPLDVVQATELINSYERWQAFAPDGDPLKQGDVETQSQRNKPAITLLPLERLEPGMYFLDVRGGGKFDKQLLAVSSTALTVKRSADQLFIWAVDVGSGQPVANLPLASVLRPYNPAQGSTEPDNLGSTDGDGILQASFTGKDAYAPLYVWSAAEGKFAFSSSDWGSDISPWAFNLPGDAVGRVVAGNLSTDRPIYRPGQLVRIKGVLRTDNDGRYSMPPANQRVLVEVNGPEGTKIFSNLLPLTEFGSFDTSLPMQEGAKLGFYSITARMENDPPERTINGSFTLAEYRKPVFEVEVAPTKPDLLAGDKIEATLTARYFAGGVLANAPVRWRLLAEPLYFSDENFGGYQFNDVDDAMLFYRWFDSSRPGGRELVSEGEGSTDANGKLSLSLPAELAKNGGSRRFVVDVEVTDVDGQVIASQADVSLHAGAFYVGLRPEGYVAQAGQPQKVNLLTLDPQGQPVANRQFEVNVFSREWYSVRQQGSDGRFYFTSAYTDTLVQTLPAQTGDQGRGEISFTPQKGGSYRLLASARDDGGRSIKASAFTWAYGGDTFWGINDSDRVDLIADKTGYKPGDTAKVLVTAPYNDMKALMTIERGQVIEHKLLTLSGSTGVLEVPIKAEYAPNIYVSLVLIRPSGSNGEVPDVRVGLVNLPVSTEQQELTINISADKPQAGPRDEVTYRITTTNAQGQGVPAEVSLALVDKAVLSLLNDPNPSLRQSFYEKRPLGVFTSQSLTALVDRVTLKLQPGTKGGAGGGVGDSVLLRRDFPDTAFWNPTLVTGADGSASVTIRLPDSLTTWRLSARGVTKDTLVGQASQEIVATRPLYVRPSFPRFLTVGDKVTLQAVVQNNTGNALDATVTLATNSQDGETAALTLMGEAEQTVNVPANGVTLVQWEAEAPSAGTVALRLNVSGGGMQDALEQTLPVQRYVTPETVASAGQVLDQVVETIRAPQNQTEGEVVVELV